MGKKDKKQLRFSKRCVASLFVRLGTDDPDVDGFVRVRLGLVTRVSAFERHTHPDTTFPSDIRTAIDIELELLPDK